MRGLPLRSIMCNNMSMSSARHNSGMMLRRPETLNGNSGMSARQQCLSRVAADAGARAENTA